MDCIIDKNNQNIPEWKGVNWDLEDESSMDIQLGLVRLFDW